MKKIKLLLISILLLSLIGCATVDDNSDKVIGLAWKPGLGSKEMNNVIEFLEQTGAEVIMLDKTTSSSISYYEDGTLSDDNLNFDFSLNDDCANILKTTESIVVDERINDIDLLILLGGEDVSPSLYTTDYELMDEPIYNPERDASDYLLARFALEKDIPILGICRGMQMLYVVNGGTLISDIPTYFEEKGEEDLYLHRAENGEKTYHLISILDNELKDIIKSGMVSSSHHQAVSNELPDNIEPIAYSDAIIEAFKIKNNDKVLAVQFHPEYYNSEEMKREGIALIQYMLSL